MSVGSLCLCVYVCVYVYVSLCVFGCTCACGKPTAEVLSLGRPLLCETDKRQIMRKRGKEIEREKERERGGERNDEQGDVAVVSRGYGVPSVGLRTVFSETLSVTSFI